MEDMVPWQFAELMKQIKDAVDIPILTGEDIYLKEDFAKLITMGAVDMIHPDLASAGGLLETKKIGDFAMEHGVAMAMHFAGTPGLVHGQPALRGRHGELHRLEHHSVDVPWWEDLVTGVPKPIFQKGFAVPSDRPASASSSSRRW
jgi:L-alanine-DL-glutamate epimerase-like enolase superfamily enzyme